jgi:predicted thioesterase
MICYDLSGDAEVIVRPEDTARCIALRADDAFPEVFATSRMIALMEVAAARAMAPLLADGQLSVGVSIEVRHTAATAVGSHVRAVATYLRSDNRFMCFHVEAFDDSGPIGHGEHARAIVEAERLTVGAERRRRTGAAFTLSNATA